MNFALEGQHLLDTSAVILMMRARELPTLLASVPFATMAELLEGAQRSNHPAGEGERIGTTLGMIPIMYPDEQTLACYADISAQLRRRGRPIPVNDLWNAALAVQHGRPLLAADAHFARVPGLSVISAR